MSAPNLKCLAEIKPRSIEYLWPGRIPLGKVTLITGNPDVGKSLLLHEICSHTTRPRIWPDGAAPIATPGSAVLLSAEDDPEDTICPRLIAAGADLHHVHLMKSVIFRGAEGKFEDRWPSLATDLEALELAIRTRPNVRLVVIDPLTAYLGDTDTNTDSKVRRILGPLADLAAKHNVAVMVLVHSNKAAMKEAIHRVGGSIAFVAAARVVWLIARDPKDPERHLMVRVKNNLSRDRTGMAFRIVPCEVPGLPGTQPRIEWEPGTIDLDADDVMSAQARVRDDGGALGRASAWLQARLSGGPVESRVLQSAAQAEGLSWRTVERAKSSLGIRARLRGSGESRTAYWELPRETGPSGASPPGPGAGGCGGPGGPGGPASQRGKSEPAAEAQDRQDRQDRQERDRGSVADFGGPETALMGSAAPDAAEVDPHAIEERLAIHEEGATATPASLLADPAVVG